LRSRSIKVDTLALGYGFTPSVEIARLLGCDLYYHPLRGDWIPRRSDDFETSIPGVFAVGDCADIGGSEIALIEGRLAGLAAAVRLGRCNETEAERIGQTLRGKLNQLYRVRSIIDRIYVPPPLESFLALLTEDTIVCRCEEVTAGQLWEKLRKGVSNMNEMKALTRIGMGRCQGRNCLGTLAALLAQKLEYEPNNLVMPRARPPARPIRIGDLLHEPLPPPVPPELKLP
jgi:NAD(P)H-nitrite reductase large subunit